MHGLAFSNFMTATINFGLTIMCFSTAQWNLAWQMAMSHRIDNAVLFGQWNPLRPSRGEARVFHVLCLRRIL